VVLELLYKDLLVVLLSTQAIMSKGLVVVVVVLVLSAQIAFQQMLVLVELE
jgi:hypothetical protein